MRARLVGSVGIAALFTALAMLPAASAARDRKPPTPPGSLAASSVTATSLTLTWSPSKDNVGVKGYDVYENGAVLSRNALSPFPVSALTCATSYAFGVDAYDAAGNHSAVSTISVTTAPCPPPPPPPPSGSAPPWRYMYDSGPAQATVAALGFNLLDVSSKRAADALPAGTRGLVWVGDYDNSTCSWEVSDSTLGSRVSAGVGDPKIAGYFISDEPDPFACPDAPSQHRARTQLIHSLDPATFVVVVVDSNSGEQTLDQIPLWAGTADYIGLDPYPCYQGEPCDYGWIDSVIAAADSANLDYWGVVQAFDDATWRWPTADELNHMLGQWAASRETGYMTFAWTWNGNTLDSQPTLESALQQFNGTAATG